MAARIYLKTSGGDSIVTSGGDAIFYKDLLSRYLDLRVELQSRLYRYYDLYVQLFSKLGRVLDLYSDFEAHAASGYMIFAKDLDTGVVTELGFVPATGDLELTGVNLPDGRYEIEVRLQGYFWKDTRSSLRFPLRIDGGEIITPLPTPRNLAYGFTRTHTGLSWNWQTEPGTVAPDEWAIWVSATEPVDTSGSPDYTVAATTPGQYSTLIAQTDLVYVAISARKDGELGSIAYITIPAPPADLDAPDGQFVRFP